MIIFYCGKCAGKPYYTKEDARPADGRCPLCGGYLEEISVKPERLDRYTPFYLLTRTNTRVNRHPTKIENKTTKKDVGERKETRPVAEPRPADRRRASADAGKGDRIENSDVLFAEKLVPDHELSEKDQELPENYQTGQYDFMNMGSRENADPVFENELLTMENLYRNNGAAARESVGLAIPENENGMNEANGVNGANNANNANNAALVSARRSGRIPHGITFNGTIVRTEQEVVHRSGIRKIWDWLRYRQSFNDTFNTVHLQDFECEYLSGPRKSTVFFGHPISFNNEFPANASIRAKGYYDKRENRIFIRRMTNEKLNVHLKLEHSEEDRTAVRRLIYFLLIVLAILLIVLNRAALLSIAASFGNFLQLVSVVTLIAGAIVFYATRNNRNLRFREKIIISIVCGVVIGTLLFFAQ